MSIRNVFDNFALLADAPNSVEKLRNLILQLAVQGKLLQQNPQDEPASALLARVEAERLLLFKKKTIKKIRENEDLLPTSSNGYLPSGWQIEWLGNLAHAITKGATPTTYGYSFQREGIRFIKVENVKNNRIVKESINDFISEEAHNSQLRSQLQSGDVLFSIAGTIGETCIVREEDLPANINQALAIIRGTKTAFLPEFLKLQLDSFVANAVKSRARGGAMNNVSLGDLKELLVYVPPLEEQKRIVAKVDELMRFCDELETKQQAKSESRVRLNNAALAPLNKAASLGPVDFEQATSRLDKHFETLFASVESVGKLRSTILQLAVQGKLVPQDLQNESAATILSITRKKRNTRIDGGQSQDRSAQLIESPFRTPTGWQWVRLAELGIFLGGGTPSKSNSAFWEGNIPWVSPKDMKKLYIEDAEDHISEQALQETTVRKIPPGSLLMVVRGMILAHSFPVALTRVEVTINQDMKALVFALPEMSDYVLLACRGLKDLMLSKVARSTHGTCRLETSDIESFLIPIPPFAEQKRILAKVNALMALCDDLEAKLHHAETNSQKLMNAAVQQVLQTVSSTSQVYDAA